MSNSIAILWMALYKVKRALHETTKKVIKRSPWLELPDLIEDFNASPLNLSSAVDRIHPRHFSSQHVHSFNKRQIATGSIVAIIIGSVFVVCIAITWISSPSCAFMFKRKPAIPLEKRNSVISKSDEDPPGTSFHGRGGSIVKASVSGPSGHRGSVRYSVSTLPGFTPEAMAQLAQSRPTSMTTDQYRAQRRASSISGGSIPPSYQPHAGRRLSSIGALPQYASVDPATGEVTPPSPASPVTPVSPSALRRSVSGPAALKLSGGQVQMHSNFNRKASIVPPSPSPLRPTFEEDES
ncbi:hypothetical protein MMC20_001827 [Loxospora ochrophaea]|nr:hypothetical protein [Loxospora ochrophaea]